jgi:hypothetical protein
MINELFLIHCSISASVRQSAQIKFKDLNLPEAVVNVLEERYSVPIRSVLSSQLKEFLSDLRTEQRALYDECAISNGDIHFLHADHFDKAMSMISQIRSKAKEYNRRLQDAWSFEFAEWSETVNTLINTMFEEGSTEARMAHGAYMRMFPTKEEFQDAIQIFVVGPNPVSMSVATNPNDPQNAAKEGAADKALNITAQLLDDLDVRAGTKVGDRQTGGSVRRGSWQITAQNLELISKHCVGFEELTNLTRDLLTIGKRLQSASVHERQDAYIEYMNLKDQIKEEAQTIIDNRTSTKGLEALQKSLSLSNTYGDLISAIASTEEIHELEELEKRINLEETIYVQRAKQLKNLFTKRSELLAARNTDIDSLLADTTPDDSIDF